MEEKAVGSKLEGKVVYRFLNREVGELEIAS